MRRLLFACIITLASQASLLHGMLEVERAAQENQLFEAVKANNLPAVQELIKKGVSVKAPDSGIWTSLHWACHNGNLQVAELLLKHKADVNAKNWCQETPLYIACMHSHLEIVRLLVDNNADVNARDEDDLLTPLHLACCCGSLKMAAMLIDGKADVNAQNWRQETPLHNACFNYHLEIARLLLSNGAHQSRNNKGQLPGDLAKKPEIKKLMRRHMWHRFYGESWIARKRYDAKYGIPKDVGEQPKWICDFPPNCVQRICYFYANG